MKRKRLDIETILKIYNLSQEKKSWKEIQEIMGFKNLTTAMSAMTTLTKYLEGKAPSEDHPLRNPAYAEVASIIKKVSVEKKSEVGITSIDTVSLVEKVEKAYEPYKVMDSAFMKFQSTIIDFIVGEVEKRSKDALVAQEAKHDEEISSLKQAHALEIEKIKEAYQARIDKLVTRNREFEQVVNAAKKSNSFAHRISQRFTTHV